MRATPLVALIVFASAAAEAQDVNELDDQTFEVEPIVYVGDRIVAPTGPPEYPDHYFGVATITYRGARLPSPPPPPEFADQMFEAPSIAYRGLGPYAGEPPLEGTLQCTPGGSMLAGLERQYPTDDTSREDLTYYLERIRFHPAALGFLNAPPAPGECAFAALHFKLDQPSDYQVINRARSGAATLGPTDRGHELVTGINLIEEGTPQIEITAREGYLSGLVERFGRTGSGEIVSLQVRRAACEGACPDGALSDHVFEVVRILD